MYESDFLDHSARHENTGADEISVAGLSGLLADDQHVLDTEVETQILTRQKARAYRAAAQTINSETWTKVGIDTDSYDPDGITDLVNNRITPTIAGYYIVTGQISMAAGVADTHRNLAIYKNGSLLSQGAALVDTNTSMNIGGVVTDLVYLDGDDYVELWVYQTSGIARPLSILASTNFLSIVGPF